MGTENITFLGTEVDHNARSLPARFACLLAVLPRCHPPGSLGDNGAGSPTSRA